MECDLISIIVLAQFPWVLWACIHLWDHRKKAKKEASDYVPLAVAEDFRKQFERIETNVFNLAGRIRQIEDIVGKEDV